MVEVRDLIGAVIEPTFNQVSDDETNMPSRYLITEILGEGAEAVVFAVTDADDPGPVSFALKQYKPILWLELPVLHHSLTLHPNYVDGHTLNFSDEVRRSKLEQYSTSQIENTHYEFYVPVFRRLMVEMMQQFFVQCTQHESQNGRSYAPLFNNPILLRRIDNNFGKFLEEQIEDDMIADAALDFIERLSIAIPDLIGRRQANVDCIPYSLMPAYNLIGLWHNGLLSEDEIQSVALPVAINKIVSDQEMETLFQFLVFVVKMGEAFCSIDDDRWAGFGGNASITKAEAIQELNLVGMNACSIIEATSVGFPSENSRKWGGLSYLWRGRLMDSLCNDHELALESCIKSLEYLDQQNCPGDRHDALMLAGRLCMATNEERATEYLREVVDIRKQLGIETR